MAEQGDLDLDTFCWILPEKKGRPLHIQRADADAGEARPLCLRRCLQAAECGYGLVEATRANRKWCDRCRKRVPLDFS